MEECEEKVEEEQGRENPVEHSWENPEKRCEAAEKSACVQFPGVLLALLAWLLGLAEEIL